MLFFVDTADIKVIKELADLGILDGVTTNPSLIAKSQNDFKDTIAHICKIVKGPVSAEVVALDYDNMIKEGKELSKIAKNVTIKLPMTLEGLKACRFFTNEGIMTNMTLCFSTSQALLAAKAGATFVSPFMGRLDDINQDGLKLIAEICKIYSNYPALKTQVLAASIRTPRQITEVALLGAHVATIPPQIIKQLISHPLTDKGIEIFLKDWGQTGQSIR